MLWCHWSRSNSRHRNRRRFQRLRRIRKTLKEEGRLEEQKVPWVYLYLHLLPFLDVKHYPMLFLSIREGIFVLHRIREIFKLKVSLTEYLVLLVPGSVLDRVFTTLGPSEGHVRPSRYIEGSANIRTSCNTFT